MKTPSKKKKRVEKASKGSKPLARWHPHLSFDGQCRAAFEFYARCLGGKFTYSMTYGESPLAGQVPREFHERVLHATFELDGQSLTGADVLPKDYRKPQGTWIMLRLDTARADRVFAALAENGKVELPIQRTFWTPRFGMVTDAFGTPWIVQASDGD